MPLPHPPITSLQNVPAFYHFTDSRNLQGIRDWGGLCSLHILNSGGINIPAPGGNDWSHVADHRVDMDRYVHLCFTTSHPMAYQAKKAGRLQDVKYLGINPAILGLPGVLFTPDVSNKSGVHPVSLTEAESIIDYEVLYARTGWGNSEIKIRRKSAEKYELLVPDFIPISYITGL